MRSFQERGDHIECNSFVGLETCLTNDKVYDLCSKWRDVNPVNFHDYLMRVNIVRERSCLTVSCIDRSSTESAHGIQVSGSWTASRCDVTTYILVCRNVPCCNSTCPTSTSPPTVQTEAVKTKRKREISKIKHKQLRWFSQSHDENSIQKEMKQFHNKVIALEYDDTYTTPCPSDSGTGLIAKVSGRDIIFGVFSGGIGLCGAALFGQSKYSSYFTNLASHHDFICFYTGICPFGYNKYIKPGYENNPEPVLFLSDGTSVKKETIDTEDAVIPKRQNN